MGTSGAWPVLDPSLLGAPVPNPPKGLGVGLNYRTHAIESGREFPTEPHLFGIEFTVDNTAPKIAVSRSGGDDAHAPHGDAHASCWSQANRPRTHNGRRRGDA